MFFRQIMAAFLVRTEPDSSMVKPAHIHITRAPQMRKAKVLRTKLVSSSTPAACATDGQPMERAMAVMAATAVMTRRLRSARMLVRVAKSHSPTVVVLNAGCSLSPDVAARTVIETGMRLPALA